MISSLIEKYHYLREIIYNKKISKRLGTVGEGSVIVRPCLLQGGALKEIHISEKVFLDGLVVLRFPTE